MAKGEILLRYYKSSYKLILSSPLLMKSEPLPYSVCLNSSVTIDVPKYSPSRSLAQQRWIWIEQKYHNAVTEKQWHIYFNYDKAFMNTTDTRDNTPYGKLKQVVAIQSTRNTASSKDGCAEDNKEVCAFCLPSSYFCNNLGISEKGCFIWGFFQPQLKPWASNPHSNLSFTAFPGQAVKALIINASP